MNAINWFHELSCYKQLNQAQRLFMTRFPSYEAFKVEHRKREELQKRVDSLEKSEFKLAQIKAILENNPKLLESIIVKKIEQALKGGGE